MVLTGCSTTTTVSEVDLVDYDEFYDGEAELVYENKELPKTAEEMIELGDSQLVQGKQEMIELGDSQLVQGKQDEALYQYVKAADQDNKSDTALYKIGDIHANRGNEALAIRAYEMALNINPDNAEANEGLAILLLNKREYENARNHLAKAEASGAVITWRVYNSLGVISDLEKDYKQAIVYYEKALTVQPQMPLILNNMGYSHYMSGDWASAEKYYRKAVLNDEFL
jgi:Flp pilus assembly protein TadD